MEFINSEVLNFRIQIARKGESFERAVSVRSEAFSRHNHPMVRAGFTVESADTATSTVLLCAESKTSGEVIGAMRLSDNRTDELGIWNELPIPKEYIGYPSLLVSRLTVHAGHSGHAARNALCKAMYLYAVAMQIRFIFVLVMPPRDRLYKPMGFKPVYEGDPLFKLKSNPYVNTKVLFAEVNRLDALWRERGHPLYRYVVQTHHADIELFSAIAGPKRRRRVSDLKLDLLPQSASTDFLLPIV